MTCSARTLTLFANYVLLSWIQYVLLYTYTSVFFIQPFAIKANILLYALYHDGHNPDLRGRWGSDHVTTIRTAVGGHDRRLQR